MRGSLCSRPSSLRCQAPHPTTSTKPSPCPGYPGAGRRLLREDWMKPRDMTKKMACGWCLGAPASADEAAKSHSRCPLGQECECRDGGHVLTENIIGRMMMY